MAAELTDAELAVLNALWEAGPTPIRPVSDRLYPEQAASGYSTVQKLLERLEAKGCVAANRVASPHVFVAAVSREAFRSRQAQALADRLAGGSVVELLALLLQQTPVTEAERARLRQAAEAAPPRGRPRQAVTSSGVLQDNVS